MFLDRPSYSTSRHAAHGALWLFGIVFVLGLATGTLLPVQSRFPWMQVASPSSANPSSPVPPPAPMTWSREGNLNVRHVVEVVRVIDGDTFEARVHLWPGLDMTTRVRLRGIDAPEMKGACADEMRMAEAATEALRSQLGGGGVAIFNIGPDKYNGRVVADVATPRTTSVSQALLASGHARPYQGGRRAGWCALSAR